MKTILLSVLVALTSAAHAEMVCDSTQEVPNQNWEKANGIYASGVNALNTITSKYNATVSAHKAAIADLSVKRTKYQKMQTFLSRLNSLVNGLKNWETLMERFDSDRQSLMQLDWENGFDQSLQSVREASFDPEFQSPLVLILEDYAELAPIDKAKIEESFAAFKISLQTADLAGAKIAVTIARTLVIKTYNNSSPLTATAEQEMNAAIAQESATGKEERVYGDYKTEATAKVADVLKFRDSFPRTSTIRACGPRIRVF